MSVTSASAGRIWTSAFFLAFRIERRKGQIVQLTKKKEILYSDTSCRFYQKKLLIEIELSLPDRFTFFSWFLLNNLQTF